MYMCICIYNKGLTLAWFGQTPCIPKVLGINPKSWEYPA